MNEAIQFAKDLVQKSRDYGEVLNEIGEALDKDDSIYVGDGIIYKSTRDEFCIMRDPVPSYFDKVSPDFPTLREAVDWLIADRQRASDSEKLQPPMTEAGREVKTPE